MLESFYRMMMEHVDTTTPRFKQALEDLGGREQLARASILDKQLVRQYRIESYNSDSKRRVFDSYVTFQEHKKSVYLFHYSNAIFLCGLEFLETDHRVEDFHYKPDEEKPAIVSARDWMRRARVWKELAAKPEPVLTLDICRFHNYHQINPLCDPTFLQGLWRKEGCDQRVTVAALIRASTSTGRP